MTPSRVSLFASLALLAAAAPFAAAAQQTVETEVKKALEDVKRANPGLVFKIDPNTGLPSSIRGYRSQAPSAGLGASTTPTEAEVRQVVEALFAQSELTAAFPQKNATAKVEAVKVRRDPDVKGQNIVHVQQRVNGIPVFGSSGRVTVNPSLAVTQLTASFSTAAVETTTPSITEADAISSARAKLKEELSQRKRDLLLDQLLAKIDETAARTELSVFDPALVKARGAAPGPIRLAYLVTIDAFRVFVDAADKKILFFYRDQPSAMLRRVYDMANSEKFPGKKLIDEETGERPDTLTPDVEIAFRNIGIVRDYFFLVHGRNSFDDNDADGPAGGAPLESYVRYGSLQNAHWCPGVMKGCPKANVMVYGPSFAGALDIAGHELT
ncbi:MAG: hypothetical protein SF182_15200, partial [Deltaproteobacteria bacterium]|nr:hypothetical protein [Deltaproteobacteria bacterium]